MIRTGARGVTIVRRLPYRRYCRNLAGRGRRRSVWFEWLPGGCAGLWRLVAAGCAPLPGVGDCARACTRGALSCNGDFAHRESWSRVPGAASRPARSLHIRHLDGGSCNACDWKMVALTNPVYDIQRLGMDFVASPRHADVLMVTGSVARNLELAMVKTYEGYSGSEISGCRGDLRL